MHGISRKPLTQKEQEALSLRAAKLRDLQSQLLQFHHNKIYTKEAVDISTKLLESNPEHYTGWNYRKLAVQHFLEIAPDSDSIQSILDEELRVVENALKSNFKSYGAWYHRKWILNKGHSSTDKELRLLGKFQKLDTRNFHAWNYRRFITELKKIPDEEELEYTKYMISNNADNISNYSAWHNRSVILSNLLAAREKGYDNKKSVLEQEFELVRESIFVDPDVQSGWFYYLWLLDQTLKQAPQLCSSWPPTDSHIYLSVNDDLNSEKSLPVLHFRSKTRMFPVILCFTEAVEGVSSSTVTVECEYHAWDDDLTWKPLSANKLGFSEVWLTYLNYPDEVKSDKAYSVNIIVSNVPGICNTYHVSFTVCVPSDYQIQTEPQTTRRISWTEENFKKCGEDSDLLHLLGDLKITSEDKPATSDMSMSAIISTEIAHYRELLSFDNCKIGKLTLARLLMAHTRLIASGIPNDGTEVDYEEILGLYRDLMEMDPAHICHYEDEYSLASWKKITSNMKSLLQFTYEHPESTSLSKKSGLCFQLKDHSLSRIGSMERLLWVQMLDLSYNKIQSLEGLEALQLLSCLNISNNKISSFLALEPIRSLKALEVLDASHNEIGSRSIDTRRFLCSSPLNHTVGNDLSTTKDVKYWEAVLIFKDLNLIQLDITGNPIVETELKVLIFELMPELKWLDGESRS